MVRRKDIVRQRPKRQCHWGHFKNQNDTAEWELEKRNEVWAHRVTEAWCFHFTLKRKRINLEIRRHMNFCKKKYFLVYVVMKCRRRRCRRRQRWQRRRHIKWPAAAASFNSLTGLMQTLVHCRDYTFYSVGTGYINVWMSVCVSVCCKPAESVIRKPLKRYSRNNGIKWKFS